MRVDLITLFPELCRAPLGESIMRRAQESGALNLQIHNLRDWTTDRHHVVDDAPFGGGQGMVMKPEPIFAAVESLRGDDSTVVLMSPQGKRFHQEMAREFSGRSHLIIICGHYEGIDHRVVEHLAGYGLLAFAAVQVFERRVLWRVGLGLVALGMALEIAQGTLTTSRSFDLADELANSTGVLLGLALAFTPLRDLLPRLVGRTG